MHCCIFPYFHHTNYDAPETLSLYSKVLKHFSIFFWAQAAIYKGFFKIEFLDRYLGNRGSPNSLNLLNAMSLATSFSDLGCSTIPNNLYLELKKNKSDFGNSSQGKSPTASTRRVALALLSYPSFQLGQLFQPYGCLHLCHPVI